jgi:hypothetical protein
VESRAGEFKRANQSVLGGGLASADSSASLQRLIHGRGGGYQSGVGVALFGAVSPFAATRKGAKLRRPCIGGVEFKSAALS